jgi:hypothetical protein
LERRDGWKRRKNATIALIVITSFSGVQKDAGTANNQLMWIDLGVTI